MSKTIKIKSWKIVVKEVDTSDICKTCGQPKIVEKEVKESLCSAIYALITDKSAQEKGYKEFLQIGRISEALRNADKSEILELDDTAYIFLRDYMEKNIPRVWAARKEVMDAVDEFMELKNKKKEEEKKEEDLTMPAPEKEDKKEEKKK
jgi:hypothetical protein